MKSLIEIIKDLPAKQWKYYGHDSEIDKIQTFSDIETTKFINRYLEIADKKFMFCKSEVAPDLFKIKHSVSAYFLGAIIANKLNIKGFLEEGKVHPDFGYHFLFVWFMSCLFHDRFWKLESDKSGVNKLQSLDKFIEGKHNLLERSSQFIPESLRSCIPQYFDYRLSEWKVIDHGIAGGLDLFDLLIKYRLGQEKKGDQGAWDFSKRVEVLYVEAAYAVAAHNIFFSDDDSVDLYKKYCLHTLINQKPLEFSNSPFLFLLGLVDTIEPLKTFQCADPDFVAKKVNFDFKKEGSKFIIQIYTGENLNFQTLVSKGKGIDRWLDLIWENDENKKLVTIKINVS